MNYVITGSLGHISKPIVEQLLAAGHHVTVISSRAENADAIRQLGAIPAIGSVEDVAFLEKTFTGADAVYTMVPPTYSAPDWKKHIRTIGENYAKALAAANVKYVVNLSSVGAHLAEGCGPVSGLHFVEKAFNAVNGLNVLHLRPGFFYYNFFANIGMIKNAGIIGANYGNDTLVMADTSDIANAAAKALLDLSFTGNSITYIVSAEKSPQEVASVLGAAIGKPELPWVDFPDSDAKAGMMQAGLSEEAASNYAEMGAAVRTGAMIADYRSTGKAIRGKVPLEEFAKVFAQVYSNS